MWPFRLSPQPDSELVTRVEALERAVAALDSERAALVRERVALVSEVGELLDRLESLHRRQSTRAQRAKQAEAEPEKSLLELMRRGKWAG